MSASYHRATQDYEVEVVEERSSRFRIPFLGKKRKSMVTLRSGGPDYVYQQPFVKPTGKTVSQLADELVIHFLPTNPPLCITLICLRANI